MKYRLIHLEVGTLAESNKMWVLEDLQKHYLDRKLIDNNMLFIIHVKPTPTNIINSNNLFNEVIK